MTAVTRYAVNNMTALNLPHAMLYNMTALTRYAVNSITAANLSHAMLYNMHRYYVQAMLWCPSIDLTCNAILPHKDFEQQYYVL